MQRDKDYGWVDVSWDGKRLSFKLIRIGRVLAGFQISTRRGHFWVAPKWERLTL